MLGLRERRHGDYGMKITWRRALTVDKGETRLAAGFPLLETNVIPALTAGITYSIPHPREKAMTWVQSGDSVDKRMPIP